MPRSDLNAFVSKFCSWVGPDSRNRRAKLASALRRAVREELPTRDGDVEIEYRLLLDSDNLACWYSSQTMWLYPTGSDSLACGVIAPDWSVGWKRISRDEYVADTVATFFRFARQYVARSRLVRVVGAVALSYNRACEFRFSNHLSLHRVADRNRDRDSWPPQIDTIERAYQSTESRPEFTPALTARRPDGRKQRELRGWIASTNTLDPFVHRAVFQFWRSTALINHHFWEESVTALDGISSVAAQFIQRRLGAAGNVRGTLAAQLGLSARDQRVLNHLYALRCDFGAHPSHSKWWDFAEIYDEEFDTFRDTAKRVISGLAALERQHRVVEPVPDVWSDWFEANALMLWDAVWFEHLR